MVKLNITLYWGRVNIIRHTHQVACWPAQMIVNVVLQLQHLRLCNCCSGDEEGTLLLKAHLCEERKSSKHIKWFISSNKRFKMRLLFFFLKCLREGCKGDNPNVYQCRVCDLPQLLPYVRPGFLAYLLQFCRPDKVTYISEFFMTQSTADPICHLVKYKWYSLLTA